MKLTGYVKAGACIHGPWVTQPNNNLEGKVMNAVNSLRYPTALAAALLITGGLFSALASMTDVKFQVIPIKTIELDFLQVRPDTDSPRRNDIVKPARIDPPIIELPPRIGGGDTKVGPPIVVSINPPSGDFSVDRSPASGNDTDAVPVVRVSPLYPQRAAQNGTEGWVQVRFTISESGAVKDPIVVDSSPKGVFDDAALKAITRWRYNPKVEGGIAVERRGIQTLLRFELNE